MLAFDLTYRHSHNTRVRGDVALPGSAPATSRLRSDSGTSAAFGFAPAIEYNWSARLGMLVGVRVITGGHATATTITPAVALNYVH